MDSEDMLFDNNNDGDLFVDSIIISPKMDLTSGLDGLNSPVELQAACPTENGQPASKVRARDEVCAPNNQPSSVDASLDNVLGIFGTPHEWEQILRAAAAAAASKTKTGSVCIYPKYPVHLCCKYEGDESNMERVEPVMIYRDEIYETMEDCEPGT